MQPTSLDYASTDNRSETGFFGISYATWCRVGVIGLLFAAVFWPNLRRLWLKTNPFTGEANWSHSIFVPMIGLYYLFINREELVRAGAREFIWGPILRPGRAVAAVVMAVVGAALYFLTCTRTGLIFTMASSTGAAVGVLGVLVFLLDWSLATMLFGLAVYEYGIYPGQNDYLKDLGMVITLFGIVLMLNGWSAMRIAWFPVAFLVCAIPWPGLVYSWVAEPLSQMAAQIAVDVLKLTNVDATCSGTRIVIFTQIGQPPRILNVAEACAGMRSLMTFIAVGAAVAFLPVRPLWQRIIIVVSAIPIAISCNVMRISGQGLLDHYVSQKWSDSFAHQFVGMIMLLPAFFLILMVGGILEKVFIEEADDSPQNQKAFTPRAATRQPAMAIAQRPAAIPPGPVTSPVTSPALPARAPAYPAAPLVSPAVPRRNPPTPPPPASGLASGSTPPRPGGGRIPPRPSTAANLRPVPPGRPVPPQNSVAQNSAAQNLAAQNSVARDSAAKEPATPASTQAASTQKEAK